MISVCRCYIRDAESEKQLSICEHRNSRSQREIYNWRNTSGNTRTTRDFVVSGRAVIITVTDQFEFDTLSVVTHVHPGHTRRSCWIYNTMLVYGLILKFAF